MLLYCSEASDGTVDAVAAAFDLGVVLDRAHGRVTEHEQRWGRAGGRVARFRIGHAEFKRLLSCLDSLVELLERELERTEKAVTEGLMDTLRWCGGGPCSRIPSR